MRRSRRVPEHNAGGGGGGGSGSKGAGGVEPGRAAALNPPVRLGFSSRSGNGDCKMPDKIVKLSDYPTAKDALFDWGGGMYFAVCAYSAEGIASRCDTSLKVEATLYDVTEGEQFATPLVEGGALVQNKARKSQYYFFKEPRFFWPGIYRFEVTASSRKWSDVKPVTHTFTVKGPNGKGRAGMPDSVFEALSASADEVEAPKAAGGSANKTKSSEKKSSSSARVQDNNKGAAVSKAHSSGGGKKFSASSQPDSSRAKRAKFSHAQDPRLAALSKNSRIRGVEPESEPPIIVDSRAYILQMPPSLMKHVTECCEGCRQSKKLVPLPRTPNVRDALESFQATLRPEDYWGRDLIDKVANSFDSLLEVTLLCQFERAQHKQIRAANKGVVPGALYGCEHLLRLLLLLPHLLGDTDPKQKMGGRMTADSPMYPSKFNVTIDRLLGFLQERHREYFNVDLEDPPSGYKSVASAE